MTFRPASGARLIPARKSFLSRHGRTLSGGLDKGNPEFSTPEFAELIDTLVKMSLELDRPRGRLAASACALKKRISEKAGAQMLTPQLGVIFAC
jgi:hypothetical protein